MLAGPATDPNQFAQDLFTGIPDRYDMLEELLSLGQNRRWRRAMVDRIVPAAPARVLDVASGTAGVALQLTERTPASVVGIDLTPAMLARGATNVRTHGAGERSWPAS
jgi:demethylmenaquinone methyltransferase/2-methoxy-6-polyprenyl-1,4-benzoquinol methylase